MRLTERPEATLAVAAVPRHLDEALVEAEVVTDGVLPARLVLVGVELEVGSDVSVDLGERCALHVRVLDGHGDERHVRVGRSRKGGFGGGRGRGRVGGRADAGECPSRRRPVTNKQVSK